MLQPGEVRWDNERNGKFPPKLRQGSRRIQKEKAIKKSIVPVETQENIAIPRKTQKSKGTKKCWNLSV